MSASSLSHASTTQNEVGSDPNHSPTMMMSQTPNHTGPIQPDRHSSPYVAVHRPHTYAVPQGPEGYPHHVMPFVPGSPHQAPQGSTDLMYTEPVPAPSQPQTQETQFNHGDASPPPSASTTRATTAKRKQPDSATSDMSGRKRRQRGPVGGEDGDEGQEVEVGPNGGAKHWTDEEKTRFFTWMLTNDEHWEAFRTRMNTVFRECSAELFPGRKSYTALKSCYHRNLEVFKQIHAFQVFSANHLRQLQSENPNTEQPMVDAMLETARVAGLNVGSLNVKAIDRWYETGWFDLFRGRYREDPKTGLPIPYYGPLNQPVASGSPPATVGFQATIDPQLIPNAHPEPQRPSSASGPVPNSTYPYSPDYHHAALNGAGHSPSNQPLSYLRSTSALPPRVLHGPSTTLLTSHNGQAPAYIGRGPSPHGSGAGDLLAMDYQAQTVHALTQLTAVTEALLGICSSLKELLQQQAEESKMRTERMRAEGAEGRVNGGKARDKEISMEKVTFATDILKNGPDNDVIKKAAVECLTKYLIRDL